MALSSADASVALDAVRLLTAAVALAAASMTDLRTRKVPNALWYVVAAVGTGLLVADLALTGEGPWGLALALPVAAFFAVVVTGGELVPVMPDDEPDPTRELTREEARVYVADLAVSAVLVAASLGVMWMAHGQLGDLDVLWGVAGSVAIIVLALVFYAARLLHGGGDAKALMTLAVLFPTAPLGGTLPLLAMPEGAGLMFPFSLTVLIDAAIIVVFLPLAFLVMSAARGPLRLPEALFGYPVANDAVDTGRAWLLYEADEAGEVRRALWPRRSQKAEQARARALEALRSRGEARVYVSPKLPFMVPMLAGLLVAAVVGNLVLGLVWALLGM